MLFVIIGHDSPDAREKRPAVRPAHLAHLEPEAKAGRVKLAARSSTAPAASSSSRRPRSPTPGPSSPATPT